MILKNVSAKVEKIMSSNPRRISEIRVHINLTLNISYDEKVLLEISADNCPIHNTLNPELIRFVNYNWI